MSLGVALWYGVGISDGGRGNVYDVGCTAHPSNDHADESENTPTVLRGLPAVAEELIPRSIAAANSLCKYTVYKLNVTITTG